MTQTDWLSSNDPESMCHLLAGRWGIRRWRLFSCACLRELGHLLPDRRARESFQVVERWAEYRAAADEVALAHLRAVESRRFLTGSTYPRAGLSRRVFARMRGVSQALLVATLPGYDAELQAGAVVLALCHADPYDPDWESRIRQMSADILRDLFGDPFRNVNLPVGWLAGRGREAVAIAQAIHDDRTFDELPILADALEDSDCPCPELARHCREPGPHGRGCWAVDVLRGEELVNLPAVTS
jgi:hypothetical protein